ncbi:MAG: hypothetical protein ACOYXC_13135 [Candidatus Rifleibacteriota bacterium]
MITGRFHDRNRLQVFFSLMVFTACSYWSFNPFGFHLLDGFTIFTALITGPVANFHVPFNITAGFPEIIFLLISSGVPLLIFWLFKRHGSDYMASLTIFWFAYACQLWFRFFHITVYRVPAAIMLCLSTILLFVGLISSLSDAEGSADRDFSSCFAEIDAAEKEKADED